jgi:hypothetical protein
MNTATPTSDQVTHYAYAVRRGPRFELIDFAAFASAALMILGPLAAGAFNL